MGKTIDNNVVELEFDNSKFEGNVKTSLSTLDKLKQSLKFDGATKGLDEVEKATKKIDFSGMSKGIDDVKFSFNTLEVAAMTAITNITNKVVDLGLKLAKSVSIDQIASGWTKMDEMTGSVQTLVNSTGLSVEQIQGYLDKLMWYSDETSYGFSDMTKALATMTASGGDIDKLIPMIEGIANATAYAGKTSAEFSRVIYNLNQSYSGGFLQLMDWKSVQLAGVNSKALMEILIQTGEELGKIQKGSVTLSNFTETLKDKWADTEVMEKAFGKFASVTEEAYKLVEESGGALTASEAYEQLAGKFDEIAERAARSAQEAKTFGEAIDSVKDAVSTKWLNIFSTIFGNYEQQKSTWTNLANDLWEIFAEPLDNFNSMLEMAFTSKWGQFGDALDDLGIDVSNLNDDFINFIKDTGDITKSIDALSSTGKESSEEWSNKVDELIEKYGSLENVITSGEIDSSAYLKKYVDQLQQADSAIGDVANALESCQKIYDNFWNGSYGDGEERIKKLTDAGIDYAEAQNLINKLAEEGHNKSGYKLIAEDIAHLSEEQLINLGITKQQAESIKSLYDEAKKANVPLEELINTIGKKSGQELLSESLHNITQIILELKNQIGNAWSKVFDSESISDSIYSIIESFNKFTAKILDIIQNSKNFENVMTIILSTFKVIGTVVDQLVRGGLSILRSILGALNISIPDLTSSIADSAASFADWLENSDGLYKILEKLGNTISNLITPVGEFFKMISENDHVQNIINGIKNAIGGLLGKLGVIDISNLNINNIKEQITTLGLKIKEGAENGLSSFGGGIGSFFSTIWENIKSVPGKIGTAVDDLSKKFTNFSINSEEALSVIKKGLATLIGIGAGAGLFKTINKFGDALQTLVSPLQSVQNMFNSFAGMSNKIGAYFEAKKNGIVIDGITKLIAVIALLALSLWALAKVDSGALWSAVGALALVVGAVIGLAITLSKLKLTGVKQNLDSLSLVILSFAGAIFLMAIAFRIVNQKDITNGIIAMVAITVSLVGSLILLGKFAQNATTNVWTIIGFSAAVFVMALALNKLAKLSISQITAGIVGMVAVTSILVGLMGMIKLIKFDAKNGLGVILLAAALMVLALDIKILASMPFETYVSGLAKMALIFGPLIALCAVMRGAQTQIAGVGATILAMTFSLLLIIGVIKLISLLTPEELVKGLTVVTIMLSVLGGIAVGLTAISKLAGSFTSMAGMSLVILSISTSLMIIAASILLISAIPEKELYKAAGVIAVMATVMGAIIFLCGKFGNLGGANAYSFKAILGIALSVAIIAAALWALTKFSDISKVEKVANSMVKVMLGLAAIFFAIGKFPPQWSTLGYTLLAILGILAEVCAAFEGINFIVNTSSNIEGLISVLEIFSNFVGMLSVVMVAIEGAGWIASIAGLGTLWAELALIGLEAITALTIWIASNVDVATVQKANEVLTEVGAVIGSFFGTLASTFVSATSDILPTIGQSLTDFANNMTGFFDALNAIPAGIVDKAIDLASVIAEVGSLKTILALGRLKDNKGLIADTTFFQDFATILVNFSDAIAGKINVTAINSASNAGKMMAGLLDSLPTTGGWLQDWGITGTKSIASFGEELVSFAQSLCTMCEYISGEGTPFNQETVNKAKTAADTMAALFEYIPDSESAWGYIVGRKDIGDFGTSLKEYGFGLVAMCQVLSEEGTAFNQDTVDKALFAGKTMAALLEYIPDSWSLKGFLEGGNKSLGTFGTQLKNYAKGLASMCEEIGDDYYVNDSTVEKAEAMGQVLSKLYDYMPQDSGFFGAFEGGTMELDTFGEQVASYFESFAETCELINGLENQIPTNYTMERIKHFVRNICNMFEVITGNADKGIAGFGDITIMSTFADYLEKFGQSIADFSDYIINYSEEKVASVLESIKNTIIELGTETSTNVETIMDDIITKMDRTEDATTSGKNTLEGLIAGLTDSGYLARITAAGYAAAETFNKAYRYKMQVKSPSKLMAENGEYTILGLLQGLTKDDDKIRKAGEEAGNNVIKSLQKSLGNNGENIVPNLNPVITPVLDLSNIQQNSGLLNTLFGNTSLSLAGNIPYGGIVQTGNTVNLNVDFTVNNAGRDLSESDVLKFSKQIATRVNEELGLLM